MVTVIFLEIPIYRANSNISSWRREAVPDAKKTAPRGLCQHTEDAQDRTQTEQAVAEMSSRQRVCAVKNRGAFGTEH